MNPLLREDVQTWISNNLHNNPYDLIFGTSPFPEIPMQDLVKQIQGRKTASKKFPKLDQPNILFPPKLNLEQTSSVITANYKCKIINGNSLIDVTGGLGIDVMAFSERFDQVVHIEKNESLQQIAQHNFQVLGLDNIQSYNADGIKYITSTKESFDVIYIDPSRRDEHQNKVFLLEDLQPNLLVNYNLILNTASTVLIKLAPLIDLHYLSEVLNNLTELHIVAVKNEVKEVLVKIDKGFSGDVIITAVNLDTPQDTFRFKLNEIAETKSKLSTLKKYLYEPNASIQKSGGINILAQNLDLTKLHNNTNLLTSENLILSFPGRVFEVEGSISQPKKELKQKSIMAIHRNFPMKLKDLAKKYKFKLDGTEPVLFSQDIDKPLIYWLRLISN